MTATPGDRPAYSPAALYKTGLDYLDEATRHARSTLPDDGRVAALAGLADAHFAAAALALEFNRIHRTTTANQGAGNFIELSATVAALRQAARQYNWVETDGDENRLIFETADQRLQVTLVNDDVTEVTLNGAPITGVVDAYGLLRRHGTPSKNVAPWPPGAPR
jgi:hypothetical protein